MGRSLWYVGGGVVHLLDLVFHKGYVIPTTNSKFDPNTIFPWMTWERFAKGRTLVGVDEDDEDFATAGLEPGEKEHQLKESEIPSHVGHLYTNDGAAFGGNAKGLYLKSSTMASYGSNPRGWVNHSNGEMLPAGTNRGGDQPHNNIQPSTTVYYWRRVS